MIKNHNLKNSLNKLKFIDLFCGIGGFRIALESFGAQCVFSSDFDKNSQDVYEDNFSERPFGDITKIDESTIPKHDILCAGFPCQPFSISGKQKGFDDNRGNLFFDIARIVKKKKPSIIILENVYHFEKHDDGNTLKKVRETLESYGYTFFHKVLNASDFGIPQSRRRTFMVSFAKKLKIKNFKFPKPIEKEISLSDLLEKNVRNNIKNLENKNVQLKSNTNSQQLLFNYIPREPIRLGIVDNGGQGNRIYDPRGHAITLSAYGGGTGAKTGLYLINKKIRKLTPRECARVSGFPEDFKLSNNKNNSYKQFGNTVVVDVVQHILMKIVDVKILKKLN